MNFSERRREAQAMVMDFLSTFSPPRGLDEGQLASRISQIADAFARRMPTDGSYSEKIAAVLVRVMDTHQSNTWPPQAAFVMAMPSREQSQFSAAETFKPQDHVELLSAKMNNGQAIPETAIWGEMAGKLPRQHLDRYRNASVAGWVSTYGHKAADAMFSKYGGVVMPYFPDERGGAA